MIIFKVNIITKHSAFSLRSFTDTDYIEVQVWVNNNSFEVFKIIIVAINIRMEKIERVFCFRQTWKFFIGKIFTVYVIW